MHLAIVSRPSLDKNSYTEILVMSFIIEHHEVCTEDHQYYLSDKCNNGDIDLKYHAFNVPDMKFLSELHLCEIGSLDRDQ